MNKFVLGFIEGQRVTKKAIDPLIEKITDEKVRNMIQERLDSLSYNSYAVKVVDEVEAFYMNFKNKDVSIGDACARVISKK